MELTPFFFGLYKLVKYGLYPLTWVTLLVGATALLACLPYSPSRLRWVRIGAAAAFALLMLVSSPVVSNQLIGRLEAWHPTPAMTTNVRFDAIVVLGGGVHDKGALRPTIELTSYSRDRTTCGVDHFLQGHAPKLVITGGDGSIFGSGPKEADEMKRWAIRLGVPEQAIVIEDQARTTYENATGTRRLLGPASILLVSSASHLPRATALFHKQGFHVTPSPCDFTSKDRPEDNWREIDLFDVIPNDIALQHTREAVTEMAGIVIYWLTGKL